MIKKLGVLAVGLVYGGLLAAEPAAYPVGNGEWTRELRSVSLQDLVDRDRLTGIWHGSPQVLEKREWYDENFYATLASRKSWHEGTSPETHEFQGPITWDIVPIPQRPPPPCDQPQPTGYDAESCRYVNALFKDLEARNPDAARLAREQARRGRDVWFKATFGNQDQQYLHFSRVAGGVEFINYPWLDTRTRSERFTRWGLINDPDCTEGDESTNWYDDCPDPFSTGVLGYRKYPALPTRDDDGEVVFDPASSPYREDEIEKNLRYDVAHSCITCHVAFDPTNPPPDPNEPDWEHIHSLIGNQYVVQPMAFFMGTPEDHFIRQVLAAGRPGTIDTSLVANDFQNNPGTQNNIMDFFNKRLFPHEMKHPVTGEVKEANTMHVLKGGEDSVGEHLALIRVFVNIGMCTEECWTRAFPKPGSFLGEKATQNVFSIEQCATDCEAWNHADAKMPDLAAFLLTGGPTYLLKATDIDGTPGEDFVDLDVVPRGRAVYIAECAVCHSSKVPPEAIRADREALARFYDGHVFGAEAFWEHEFTAEERESERFRERHLVEDNGALRPRQFAENGIFGQDWLSNDERVPFHVIGTNKCRALHDNHNEGHVWEEFSSVTYKESPSPGSVPRVINRMFPLLGGTQVGEREITGGPGYYRNFSLLSAWATAPFLHNNAIGEMTYLDDGTIDYTVAGRIKQFEMAYEELMMSDDPEVTPSRPQRISKTDRKIRIAPREDGQGPVKLPVAEGTPIGHFTSSDPHRPLFQKCDDLVENKGHQFGIDLSDDDKYALREFLKLM